MPTRLTETHRLKKRQYTELVNLWQPDALGARLQFERKMDS
jgi:hypothetical protein